jgi:hypothetical protein
MYGDRLIIRAQDWHGRIHEIGVPNEHVEEASEIRGGGEVAFEYRGGRAFFVPARYRWPIPGQQEVL